MARVVIRSGVEVAGNGIEGVAVAAHGGDDGQDVLLAVDGASGGVAERVAT